jgi:hypothetical protein
MAEVGVVTWGLGMAAMHVIRESDSVMFAAICGGAEGQRLRRETCPPISSLQHTHRQLDEVESTASPSAAHVSWKGEGILN